MSCIVKECKSVRRFKPKGVTFHRIPQGSMQQVWLQALGLSDAWTWTPNKIICSKHFKQSDFITCNNKIYLKQSAVPQNPQIIPQVKPVGAPKLVTYPRDLGQSISLLSASGSSSTSSTSKPSTSVEISARKRVGTKRVIDQSSDSMTSASTDSSTKRKRVKLISIMHNYSISPGKIKKKYNTIRSEQAKSRKKLYAAKKNIKTLRRKITSLTTIVQDLKKNQTLSETAILHLEKSFEDVPSILMSRYIKNSSSGTTSRETYPPKLRAFAATLQFYSGQAYEYVRETFALALPHASVLRKWFSNVDCGPGFCDPAFDALKIKVEEAKAQNHQVICALLLDEMAIKKQIDIDGKRTWGYIDIGSGIETDDLQPATEVLVLMVVCHNLHWKLPIAYFFIKSLTGKERANIINEALIRLNEVEVSITSVTCDGPNVHFTMLKELGCNFSDVKNMQTWFPHPADSTVKVFCLLDVCHMIKILRNMWATLGLFKNFQGSIIDWNLIKKLFELQDKEGLKLANKLKRSHIEWYKQKMKVTLAAQTLSSSIADALQFLHEIKYAGFEEVSATVEFIRKVDRLFDLLNSRSPWARGYKAPMSEHNEVQWRPFMLEAIEFLLGCTDVSGRPLWCTPKKTPILGFVISTLSVMGIYDEFVKKGELKYLLTYKCSQDHLETFFCSVRARNGWNNNPTAKQFFYTFRRLLLFSKISKRGGNCRVLDNTTVLTIASTKPQISKAADCVDVSVMRRYQLDLDYEHDYDVLPINIPLNEFSANVVSYISGYVLKMLQKTVKCEHCVYACTAFESDIHSLPNYKLLTMKNRGGLQIPSVGVVRICQTTEQFVKRLLILTNNRVPSEDNFLISFTIAVAQKFYGIVRELFVDVDEHFTNFSMGDENHSYVLIKKIVGSYARIRFLNFAKTYTQVIQGPVVRQALTKLILFNHQ